VLVNFVQIYKLEVESWNEEFEKGKVVLIDKPLNWTSFDVVKKIRGITKTSKVGHAGTLDPLATGLLIVCTGKFTKRINEFMAAEKEYTGSFTLGYTTPSYDLETEPVFQSSIEHITDDMIHSATGSFVGEFMQVPPIYSAIKKDGKAAYLSARKGEEVKMEPRPIRIKSFEITSIELPRIDFRVVCSTGTYIRSLAFDFGNALGSGAHLSALIRTRIGEYWLDQATSLEAFSGEVNQLKGNPTK
jgi:tRNA pseudouridine55 synthase